MMSTTEEWLAQAGNLGQRLRSLRKQAQLTGPRLASDLSWPQSKVSKIETGRQTPTAEDVTAWCRRCGASEAITTELLRQTAEAQLLHRQWRTQIRTGQVAVQRRFNDMVRQAHTIRNFEVVYVPGLLQTAEYARHRLLEYQWMTRAADTPDLTPSTVAADSATEIDAATAERMRRQRVLYEPGRQFEFITTEAALRVLLCPPDVMLGQLDRLMALTDGMPNVRFGIIPFGVQLPLAPQHGFLLLDDDVAAVETISGETMHRGPEAAVYLRAMGQLAAHAVHGAEARLLIANASAALRDPES